MAPALALLALLRAAAALSPEAAVARVPLPPGIARAEIVRACRLETRCTRIGPHGDRHNPPGGRYLAAARKALARACPARRDLGAEHGAAWGPRGIVGLSPAYFLPEGQPCAHPAILDWPWVSAVRGAARLGALRALGYSTPRDRRAAWAGGIVRTRHLRQR